MEIERGVMTLRRVRKKAYRKEEETRGKRKKNRNMFID